MIFLWILRKAWPLLQLNNVVGVKGPSAFSCLVKGLPLSAPTDYMHCVLLGVFPDTLRLCFKSLNADQKTAMIDILKNLACPREMIAYSRKIRPLDELVLFKANELFNWMFYISPVVFRDQLPKNLFSHLLNLVFGIRLLLETSSPSCVSEAEKMLDNFCKDILSVHNGNEKIERINVHCITHLADQVRRFGPLYTFSAMSFEAANRSLVELFSGSNAECQVICRRILQRHRLANVQIDNDVLGGLFNHITGKEEISCISKETAETDAIKFARSQYPTVLILNRHIVRQSYFDSTSLKRSKLGNCYAYYLENEREVFGEIQYFIKCSDPPFNNDVYANVLIHATLKDFGSVTGYIFKVCRTSKENVVPVNSLYKVFCYNEAVDGERDEVSFMIKLCSLFDHS